jgi:hypothetical protein
MIGYRYFRGDFRYLRGLRQSTLFGLRWAAKRVRLYPTLCESWRGDFGLFQGGPLPEDYTPRFVLFGVGSSFAIRVCGETRLEIASLHTLRKGK